MQQTNATYQSLLAAGAPKQVRARIYYTSSLYDIYYGYYDPNNPNGAQIVSATTRSAMLNEDLGVGNCIAKELNIVLRNYEGFHAIPKMARIVMQFRLSDGSRSSPWYPKGTYYIDTREEGNGVMSITAYDAMLKAERQFTVEGEQGSWPRVDIDVVRLIASGILSVPLDDRTEEILTRAYEVGYPGFGDRAYTARQVLGFIGAMYAGNWIITDQDKLRLIVLGDIPADTNYLVNQAGDYITMGGYRIRVSR